MKIGIVGAGNVARSLGKGLTDAGHEVMLGSREPAKKELVSWKRQVKKKGSIGTTTEAANFGEIIVLAIAWHATEDVLQQVRPELAGKVVIDVTNPLVFANDGPPTLSVGHSMSGGEIVQQSLPDSHVVKTLNIINHAHMSQPNYSDGIPMMFLCGNNVSGKKQVVSLLQDLGWQDLVDIGDITKCRILEPLCLLWVEYGVARGTWDHALAILNH